MAFIANGTTLSIGIGAAAAVVVDASDINITASSATVDATALNSLFTLALQGRPNVTGSATIHTDNATAGTLAAKFGGATPDTAAVTITINASGGASGGIDYTGSAVITGFNATYANDAVHQATLSWQYVGQITVSRSA
jgi:hypothetical protein